MQKEVETRKLQIEQLVKEIKKFPDITDEKTRANFYAIVLEQTMVDVEDEQELYNLTQKLPELKPYLLEVVDAITDVFKMEEYGHQNIFWVDSEIMAGSIIASRLALDCEQYVPVFTKYMNHCKMDSAGIEIYEALVAILKKWGFSKETCKMLVSYILQGDGWIEWDDEEFSFKEIMKDQENRNIFLNEILTWWNSSVPAAQFTRKGFIYDDNGLQIEQLTNAFEIILNIDEEEAEEEAEKLILEYTDSIKEAMYSKEPNVIF
ncbi:hypothetical protein A4S06_10000 [Erysipelotrichaceae bacterium MTC7]|nr:hypothetical protein A4S06_10000 [Erysipelotrichaceae bacterium MTC7]